jgi:hypothetical protein
MYIYTEREREREKELPAAGEKPAALLQLCCSSVAALRKVIKHTHI